jgi:hypothetical protein
MGVLAAGVERMMKRLLGPPKGSDLRRFESIEDAKRGHGGIGDIAGNGACRRSSTARGCQRGQEP